MRSKYHAKKAEVDGIVFDSRLEAKRYQQLMVLENIGVIKDLKRQVKYELIPPFSWSNGRKDRGVNYIADFVYTTDTGERVVEDVKGMATREFIIKRKMVKKIYDIEVSIWPKKRKKT